jgi:hypothetical protein
VKKLPVPTLLILALPGMALSACASQPATIPTPLPTVLVPARPAQTDIPTPLAPEASFEPAVYSDPVIGIELDYPSGWMVDLANVGARASQAQISSWQHAPGDPLTGRPEGSTVVNVTAYQWDPQNDLAAYVTQRKLAWESSGFGVLSEESITLKEGWPAVALVVQFPEGKSLFLFTYVGASYLEVSGNGDLELVRRIAFTLRPMGHQ